MHSDNDNTIVPHPLYSIIFIRTYYYLLVVHHTFKTGMMADSARLLTDAEIYYAGQNIIYGRERFKAK